MTAIYKIKVTFESIDYDFDRDEDVWEDSWETVTLLADSQEEAEELATEEINENYSAVRNLDFESLEIVECPPDKFVLNPDRNLVSDCGRFVSDGYVLIEKELGFIHKPHDRFANPFPEYEAALGEPLGEYAIYDKGQVAVFEAGLFNPDFVQRLNQIGVVVCAVGTREWPAPFALAKDGRYVGVIMPKHFGTDNLLESAESRRKFIEIQRESGSVFNQAQ